MELLKREETQTQRCSALTAAPGWANAHRIPGIPGNPTGSKWHIPGCLKLQHSPGSAASTARPLPALTRMNSLIKAFQVKLDARINLLRN